MADVLDESKISGGGKPREILSEAQVSGVQEFEKEARAQLGLLSGVKEVATGTARRGGSLLAATGDLILGVPGMVAGHVMNIGTQMYAAAVGENAKIAGQAGELAEALPTIKVPGTKIEIPLEPLKTPLSSLLKMATGTEPWNQDSVAHLIETAAVKAEAASGGTVTSEQVKLGIGAFMDIAGVRGGQMAAKGYVNRFGAKYEGKPQILTETEIAAEPPQGMPGPAAVEITTPKQVKEIFDRAKRDGTANARDVAWVQELFENAKKPRPVEGVVEASVEAPPVVKTRLTDGRIIGEATPPALDATLDSALKKVSAGQRFALSAEERISLQDLYKTSKIVDADGNPISSRQGGRATPEMLLWLTGLSAATAAGVNLLLDYKGDDRRVGTPLTDRLFVAEDSAGWEKFAPLASAAGWVKAKGGMWHPEAVKRLSRPMQESLFPDSAKLEAIRNFGAKPEIYKQLPPEEQLVVNQALAAERMVKSYLNKHAGTEFDPLKDVEIPSGLTDSGMIRWENAMDSHVVNMRKGDYAPDLQEQLKGAKPSEQIWDLDDTTQTLQDVKSYLSHLGDFLRQNVDPAKLSQYDLVRAVKEERAHAAKMERMAEKAAAASSKDLPVYRDYAQDNPGTLPGMRWVELTLPEQLTPEQAKGVKEVTVDYMRSLVEKTDFDDAVATLKAEGLAVTPENLHEILSADQFADFKPYMAVDSQGRPIENSYTREIAAGRTPQEAWLAGRLAEEGNQMGHCVGGYCQPVAAGESRIYSLRDAKGKSHVTVEAEGTLTNPDGSLEPAAIIQIKGKGNRAPVADYLPYVQDFVKKGKWGEVGDLGNTGLLKVDVNGTVKSPGGGNLSRTDKAPGYYTKQELGLAAATGAAVGTGLLLSDQPPDEFTSLAAGLIGATLAKKGGKFTDLSEPKLLEAMRAGSQGAFAEIYQRTQSQAKRTAASFGEAADDIVQRAYEKAFRAVSNGQFREESKFSTFLHRVIQNEGKNKVVYERARPTESLDRPLGPEGDATLGDTLASNVTPESTALNTRLAERMQRALDKLPENFRRPFEMRELEGLSYEEIATQLGQPIGTVRSQIARAKEQLQGSLREYKDGQAGNIDPALLKTLGLASTGAAVGGLYAKDSLQGAVTGGILGLAAAALGTGPARAALMRGTTRLMEQAPELRRAGRDMELAASQQTARASEAITAFLKPAKKLSKEKYALLDKAYSEANSEMLKAVMHGNSELLAGYGQVRRFLNETGAKLQSFGRFKEGIPDYLPLMVKDYKGLMESLGQETRAGLQDFIHKANTKSIMKYGRELNEVERSMLISDYMLRDPATSYLPGYAKSRRLKMTPQTRPFYHALEDALIHYAHAAVEDISTATFFGKDLRTSKQGTKLFTNVDRSIGALVDRLMEEGKLTPEGAVDVRAVLYERFGKGTKAPSGWMQDIRNATGTALLGQIGSGLIQTSEGLLSTYHHGIVEAIQAGALTVTGRGIKPAEFGLANHVIEEVVGRRASGQVLSAALKINLLAAFDQIGMQQNLTASFVKNKALVKSPRGIETLREKWGADYGPDFPQLVRELQASTKTARTPLVDSLLYQELSDVRPTSRLEATELYNAHPNARIMYHLKQFMLTQADILYRDSIRKIKTGDPKQVAIGVKNFALYAGALSLAVVPSDAIKNWLSGRGLRLDKIDYVDNFVRNFGLSRYTIDKVGNSNKPGLAAAEAAVDLVTPPVASVAKTIGKGLSDPKELVPHFPVGGRIYYDRELGGNLRREIRETRNENLGKLKHEKKPLSPEAKQYLREKRLKKLADDTARRAAR